MSASQVVDCSASTGDDDGMDGYTYDELVQLHEQMTRQVNHLTVEGLVEFRVNQHKGRIEVLVDARTIMAVRGSAATFGCEDPSEVLVQDSHSQCGASKHVTVAD